jgi:porin
MRPNRAALFVLMAVVLGSAMAAPVRADSGPCDVPQGPPQLPDKFDWNSAYLLGDPGGWRRKAWDAGINLCTWYNASAYYNARGGLNRGGIAQGQIFSWIDLDLGKLTHADLLNDTFVHAAMYSMQGRPITVHEVGSFAPVTFFEELTTTRLAAVWVEKRLLDGKLSLRAGQLGVDDEFIISSTATAFINGTFGFPSWMGTILPGGGVAYPLDGPGARLKYSPTDAMTLMGGVFTGDPAGRVNPVPQLDDRYGTTFNLNGGTFYIAEAAYSTAYANSGVALPGTYKLGAWFETGNRFDSPRYDITGGLLADPNSSGVPKRYSQDWGVYGIIDQTLFSGDKDGVHKLASFLRVGGSPSDRNLIDFYIDGGFTFTGLIPQRPTDLIGVGASYNRISPAARGFDRDTRAIAALAATTDPASFTLPTSPFAPVRDQEVMIEAIYTINITPYFVVDFEVQHFFHPSGHVLAPTGPGLGTVVRDATVFGLNTQVKF